MLYMRLKIPGEGISPMLLRFLVTYSENSQFRSLPYMNIDFRKNRFRILKKLSHKTNIIEEIISSLKFLKEISILESNEGSHKPKYWNI